MIRLVSLSAKAAVSLALLWWILHSVDGSMMAAAWRKVSLPAIALCLVLVGLQNVIIGWRWHRIVTWLGGHLSPSRAVHWVFVGLFFNNALPTSFGGDAVRAWKLRSDGATLGVAIGSVAIERATGVALLGMLIAVCVPALPDGSIGPELRLALLLTGPVLVITLILACTADRIAPARLSPRLWKALSYFAVALKKVGRPARVFEIVLLGVTASLTGLLAAYVIGSELGIALGPVAYVTLVGGAVLLSTLPVSLGGWGVREAGMVALFGMVGIEPERAIALSVTWGLLPVVVSLPAGLTWWVGGDRHGQGAARDPISPGVGGTHRAD